jgi:hypothetical protein
MHIGGAYGVWHYLNILVILLFLLISHNSSIFLEKVSSGNHLNDSEKLEYLQVVSRIKRICKRAYECNLPIFIDAEESWIQQAIDDLAIEMMKEFKLMLSIRPRCLSSSSTNRKREVEKLVTSKQELIKRLHMKNNQEHAQHIPSWDI